MSNIEVTDGDTVVVSSTTEVTEVTVSTDETIVVEVSPALTMPSSSGGSGLSGYVNVTPVGSVFDVGAMVDSGAASVACSFTSTSPATIVMPSASTTLGPQFTLMLAYPFTPSSISWEMDGSPMDPFISGIIDAGPDLGLPFAANEFAASPVSDGVDGYSWAFAPLGLPSPGDIGAATSAQGDLADSAVQPGDLPSFGDIVTRDANEFATSAQGSLADTAVQPGDLPAPQTAADVAVTSAGFDGNLAPTDDNIQKVAQAIDDLELAPTVLTISPDAIGTVAPGQNLVLTSTDGVLDTQMVAVEVGDGGDGMVSAPRAADHPGQFLVFTGSTGSNPIGFVEVDPTPIAGFMGVSDAFGAIGAAAYGTVLDLTTATLGAPLIPAVWVDGVEETGPAVDDTFDFTAPENINAELFRLGQALLSHLDGLVTIDMMSGLVTSLTTGLTSEVRFSESMPTIAGVDLASLDQDEHGYLGRVRAGGDSTTGLGADGFYDANEWLLEGAFGTHTMPNSSGDDHKAQLYVASLDTSGNSDDDWGGYKWTTVASNYRLELLTSAGYYTLIDGPKLNAVLYQAEKLMASIRTVTASVADGDNTITLTSGAFDPTLDASAIVAGWNPAGITNLMAAQELGNAGFLTLASITSPTEAELSGPAAQTGSFTFAVARPLNRLVEHLLDVVDGLGSAATADTGDFASSSQGTLADTALQPGDPASSLNVGTLNGNLVSVSGGTVEEVVQAVDNLSLGGVSVPGAYIDNQFYLLTGTSTTQATTGINCPAASQSLWRLKVDEPITVDGLFVYIHTGVASATWNIGIYAASSTTGLGLGAPVIQVLGIDAGTGGVYKTELFTGVTLQPGYYFGAIQASGAGTQYRGANAPVSSLEAGIGAAGNGTNLTHTYTHTYSVGAMATLPDPYVYNGSVTAAPYVRWRVQR